MFVQQRVIWMPLAGAIPAWILFCFLYGILLRSVFLDRDFLHSFLLPRLAFLESSARQFFQLSHVDAASSFFPQFVGASTRITRTRPTKTPLDLGAVGSDPELHLLLLTYLCWAAFFFVLLFLQSTAHGFAFLEARGQRRRDIRQHPDRPEPPPVRFEDVKYWNQHRSFWLLWGNRVVGNTLEQGVIFLPVLAVYAVATAEGAGSLGNKGTSSALGTSGSTAGMTIVVGGCYGAAAYGAVWLLFRFLYPVFFGLRGFSPILFGSTLPAYIVVVAMIVESAAAAVAAEGNDGNDLWTISTMLVRAILGAEQRSGEEPARAVDEGGGVRADL